MMSPPEKKLPPRQSKSALAGIFITLLYLPLVCGIFNISSKAQLQEKRVITQKETFNRADIFQYLRRYTAYYNDNFIFRDTLVHSHLLFKFRCFGVSAVPKVIIGKEGWLFMGKENKTPGSAGYFSSIQPFTRLQLEQWRVALEERQKWLANRGIFYLFIPTPDKSIIYPEYLPDSLRPFYRRSRVDQLVQYLEKHSSVPVVKLKDALLAGKKENRLYFKTDSHWNDYGACIAYGEIMKRVDAIFKTAGPTAAKSVADFRIKKRKKKKGGNLAVMLSMQDSYFTEERFRFRPREPFHYKRADFSQEGISRSVKAAVTEYAGAGFRGAVMLHDSFGRKLKPFLSEHFSRIVYLRDWGFNFHTGVIGREGPSIVLDEVAEHFLYKTMLADSWKSVSDGPSGG